jgi:hypothetical protein
MRIVSDRGAQFISKFWGTHLNLSSAYHPQTNGQTKRVSHILEHILRACALQHERSWNKSLQYTEFSDNNSYQEGWKIAPLKMLYDHRCRTPLFWMIRENGNFLEPTNCKKS